jgi:hypothetical protein
VGWLPREFLFYAGAPSVFKRLTGVLKAFEQLFHPKPGEPPASEAPPQAPPRTPSPAAADLLAWSQTQAKQSDDARKARIRAQVERVAPPPRVTDRPAVGLGGGRRHPLPLGPQPRVARIVRLLRLRL